MKRRRFIQLSILALLSVTSTVVFLRWNGIRLNYTVGPTAKTESAGCIIPRLDSMDPSIARFIQKEPPLNCGNGSQPFVKSSLSSMWITDQNMTSCCYQRFHYETRFNYGYSKDCVTFDQEGRISLAPELNMEFVRVKCIDTFSNESYDFHAFVPLKEEVEKRCKKTSNSNVNVLMLGLDAVSRINFHRQMPQTVQMLRRLEAIEMSGYNKIGDNTFPNMVGVLAGMSESELKKVCWPKKKSYFDECPFIWKQFSKAGYRTLFLEDTPYIGMFDFEKSGFKKPPTDYYLTPFMRALDVEIGHHGLETANRCAGRRFQIEIVLDYVEKFITTFPNELYWGLAWSSTMTHDNLNGPQLFDSLLSDTLERWYSNQLMQNTVLILLSDHGIRTGKIRRTHQGYLEERLPLLFFLFPDWFKRQHSTAIKILKENARRLTSPYDLHETLLDLLNLQTLGSHKSTRLGRSLLGPKAIPLERSCADVGISSHWCTCESALSVSINSNEAEYAAFTLVDYINELLKPFHPQCAVLKLSNIESVRGRYQGGTAKNQSRTIPKDYAVAIKTSPGGALFEATLTNDGNKLHVQMRDISRINLYGNQSHCIHDFDMKMFCYCID